jgi:hypothetical protein
MHSLIAGHPELWVQSKHMVAHWPPQLCCWDVQFCKQPMSP